MWAVSTSGWCQEVSLLRDSRGKMWPEGTILEMVGTWFRSGVAHKTTLKCKNFCLFLLFYFSSAQCKGSSVHISSGWLKKSQSESQLLLMILWFCPLIDNSDHAAMNWWTFLLFVSPHYIPDNMSLLALIRTQSLLTPSVGKKTMK